MIGRKFRTGLKIAAVCMAAGGLAFWLVAGANRGWSKTTVPVKVLDEITGIEAVVYEQRFVPGLDFLGATLLGAGLMAGASCLVGRRTDVPIPV